MTGSVLHRNTQLGKLSYDGNLNVSGYDGWTFGHDAEKRLLSVTGHGHSALFAYDGLGRCVKRIIDGATTVFTYDGWKPVAEWTRGGTFVAWNLYGVGADEILVRYQQNPAGYLHYHLDAMGNVQFLLSDQPNPGLEKYTYDVFGKPTITGWNGDGRPVSNHGNRFLFTGREYLYSFGLYDYRHRIYHPGLGRFIETDPLGQQIEGAKLSAEQTALFGDGAPETFSSSELNLYRYCHNNPVDKSDPTGLYGMGKGWTNEQWKKFVAAQNSAIAAIQKALKNMDGKQFERVFGEGSATKENMATVSGFLRKDLAALQDNGKGGYFATPVTAQQLQKEGKPAATFGLGTINGPGIRINVNHSQMNNPPEFVWTVGHEGLHNFGLRDHAYKGDAGYGQLSTRDAMRNPDSLMDFTLGR